MISTGAFLLLVGLILYIGVVGSYIFERYRIPDVLNLILIGLLLGPVFHVVKPEVLTPWMPYIGAMALGLILFEGGLDLDLNNIIQRAGMSTLLAAATFFSSMLAISLIYRSITGAAWIPSLLLGSILGCVSSAVILPISAQLNVPDRVRTTINLESVISDLFGVVTTLVLIRLAPLAGFEPGQIVHSVAGAFSLAIIGAVAFGLAWLWALDRLKKSPFAYMMTLAAVFVLYGLIELVHGSGPMAALTFGVVLTNADKLLAVFGRTFKFVLDEKIRWFNTEATFFGRTFFFVYLGLVISLKAFDMEFFQVAGAAVAAILVCRYAVVKLVLRAEQEAEHANLYLAMIPRGLTSAVLAGMAWGAGIAGTERFLDHTFIAILLTNFLMTLSIYRTERRTADEAAAPAKKPA